MKKAFWIIFSIILVAGLGFGGWYFFLRVPYFKVEFYGDIEIVAYLSGDGKYKEGEEVSLYAQEKQGYTFDCWIKDDQVVSTDKKYTFIMTKDTAGKYSARYTALEYNINTPHNEHIEIESNANTGEIVSVNVTIVDGYEVDEMYYIVEGTSDKVVIKNNQFKMPGTNIQVFVTFKESTYTISYDLQGGTCEGLPTSYTINSQAINIPNPTKEGYMFDGWTDDNNNIPTKSYTIVQGSTGDIKLVAHWTKGSYSITKNVQGQGILNIQQNAVIGDTINFSTFAADGYYLKEVYYIVNGTEDKVVVEDSFAMPGDNITVCAIFEKTVYTITTHQEKCTIELSQDSACYGDELTINVIPNIGYQVESQYYVIQGQDQQIPLENTLSMPLGNIEIFVVVSAISYDISYVSQVELPDDIETKYTIESTIILPTLTKEGYTFVGWYDNEQYKGETIDRIQNRYGEMTLYACFVINTYTITFVDEEGYSLAIMSVEHGTLPAYNGTTPTKKSTLEYRYTFAGWTPALYNADKDQTYTAVFDQEVIPYTITFDSNGGSYVESRQYSYMQELGVLPIPTKEGCDFVGWCIDLENNIQVTPVSKIQEDIVVVAKWSLTNYTLTYNLDGGSADNLPQTYTIETNTFTLPQPTKTGYDFVGWSPSPTDNPKTTYTIVKGTTGNKTFTAKWKISTYTIVWQNYDGSLLERDTNVQYNTMPTYDGQTPTKASTAVYEYTFAGWNPAVTICTKDQVYIAQFAESAREYTITVESIVFGSVNCIDSAKPGETVVVTISITDGCQLSQLYYTQEGSNTHIDIIDNSFVMPASNITIYADITNIPTYTLILGENSGTVNGVTLSHNTAPAGETITIILPDDFKVPAGYKLYLEYRNIKGIESITYLDQLTFEMPDYDIRVYVELYLIEYTITEASVEHGKIYCRTSGVSISAAQANTRIDVTFSVDEGYKLSRTYYILDGQTTEIEFKNYFVMPEGNVTVYAEFVSITPKYTIEFKFFDSLYEGLLEGTTISHTEAEAGETITIILPEGLVIPEGYYIHAEYKDADLPIEDWIIIENLTFEMPAFNVSAYVDVLMIHYDIDTVCEHGSISYRRQTLHTMVEMYVTVTPDEGYELSRLYYVVEGTNVEVEFKTTFVVPVGNLTIYAEFVSITPKYTFELYCYDYVNYDSGILEGTRMSHTEASEGEIVTIILPEGFVLPEGYYITAGYSSAMFQLDIYNTIENFTFEMPAFNVTVWVEIRPMEFYDLDTKCEHGSISYTYHQKANGEIEVRATVTPDEGYEVSRLYYMEYLYQEQVEFVDSFIMPYGHATVYVEFVETPVQHTITFIIADDELAGSTISHTQAYAGETVTITLPEGFVESSGKDVRAYYSSIDGDLNASIYNLTFEMAEYDIEVTIYLSGRVPTHNGGTDD